MDNMYPILLEQLINSITKKDVINDRIREEEFVYYYLNDIYELNEGQKKIFINFILKNIEIVKDGIDNLSIERLKDVFNNFNDNNINTIFSHTAFKEIVRYILQIGL